MKATGDVRAAAERLLANARKNKLHTADLHTTDLARAPHNLLLPLLHSAALADTTLASHWAHKSYDLYAQTDARFVETLFRLLRNELSYRPALTPAQFFSSGYAEHKLLLVADVLELCRAKALELARERGAVPMTQRASRPATSAGTAPAGRDLKSEAPSPRTGSAPRRASRMVPHATRAPEHAVSPSDMAGKLAMRAGAAAAAAAATATAVSPVASAAPAGEAPAPSGGAALARALAVVPSQPQILVGRPAATRSSEWGRVAPPLSRDSSCDDSDSDEMSSWLVASVKGSPAEMGAGGSAAASVFLTDVQDEPPSCQAPAPSHIGAAAALVTQADGASAHELTSLRSTVSEMCVRLDALQLKTDHFFERVLRRLSALESKSERVAV